LHLKDYSRYEDCSEHCSGYKTEVFSKKAEGQDNDKANIQIGHAGATTAGIVDSRSS